MGFQTAKPARWRLGPVFRMSLGTQDSPLNNPPARTTQARRLARCPRCGHHGAIPATAPTTARLRCLACGVSVFVRQAIGERPARYRPPSPTTVAKRAAVAAVLRRFGELELDDRLDDLWNDHKAGAMTAGDRRHIHIAGHA